MKERANFFLHFIDKYIGIVLVLFLRCFRKKRTLGMHYHSIACLKLSGIGDTILLSAVIHDIKKQYPLSNITLFVGQNNYEIASWIPEVKVTCLKVTTPFQCLHKIRQKSYDLWIDFDPWPRINALFTFFSHAKCTIGFRTLHQYRHYLYDAVLSHEKNLHEIENYRNLVSLIHVKGHSLPHFSFPKLPKKKQIVLHFFSSGSKAHLKQWPMSYWRRLILKLQKKDFLISITGNQFQRENIDQFISVCEFTNVQNLAGSFSLKELAFYLKQCVLCITIDTGIAHLAASIDLPTLVIHGPTHPKHWGALGKTVDYLFAEKGGGCIRLGFDTKCKTNECMQNISPEKVFEKALKMLSQSDNAFQSPSNSLPSKSLLDIPV